MAVSTTAFSESFDFLDSEMWYTSDFVMSEGWIDTNWSKNNVHLKNGEVRLELNTTDSRGKDFTGAEIQTNDRYGYGRYEVTMKPSGEVGVNSSFFTYTGPYFGDTWNEIDFEFLGKDPTKVSIAYHNGTTSWSKTIDLGFDASKSYNTYAFDWAPDKITWYVNGEEIYTATGPNIPDTPGKLYMNIWTGMESWLGEPTFEGSTSAHYQHVSYTPSNPDDLPEYDDGGTPDTPGKVILHLTDSETGKPLGRISDGKVFKVSAADLDELTIVAKVAKANGTVGSIQFDLDGAIDKTVIENKVPYAVFGDDDGVLVGGMKAGSYSLKTDAYSQDGATGTLRATTDVDFKIKIAGAAKPPTIDVRVIDGGSGKVLTKLKDGDTLDTRALKTDDFAFLANIRGKKAAVEDVESLVFDLDGPTGHKQVENTVPWSLFGDDGETPHDKPLSAGSYGLEIDAYSSKDGSGALLASHDFDFFIV